MIKELHVPEPLFPLHQSVEQGAHVLGEVLRRARDRKEPDSGAIQERSRADDSRKLAELKSAVRTGGDLMTTRAWPERVSLLPYMLCGLVGWAFGWQGIPAAPWLGACSAGWPGEMSGVFEARRVAEWERTLLEIGNRQR